MSISFLPVVRRELSVASRRIGTYWTRVAIASGAVVIGGFILLFSVSLPPQKVGYFIFQGLAGLCLLFCLLYGRQATADCLSSEKREGTLGLLFLTDLKGHDVILGKLAATSMGGFYGLLAIFPVLGIPLLMGGTTSGEFWRVVVVLVNTFLFSLSVGICVSSMSWDARRAMGTNFLVLLLIAGIPPAIAFVLAASQNGTLRTELLLSCPVYSFAVAMAGPYVAHKQDYWTSVALIHALTWAMLLVASRAVARKWQDRPMVRADKSWKGRFRAWSYGSAAGQAIFRREALQRNAFYWLAARARLKPRHVWLFLAGVACWWVVGALSSGKLWLDDIVFILMALLLNSTLKIWLTIEACQRLGEDHKSGALELLLSTDLSAKDILHGQWLALRRQFGRPLVVVILLEVCFMLILRRRSHDEVTVPLWIAGIGILVADLVTAGWQGMLMALRAKNPQQATLHTVSRVLLLPWILVGGVTAFLGVWIQLTMTTGWDPGWKYYLSLWVAFSLGVDLVFGLRAWARLRTGFRGLVLHHYAPPASRKFWKREKPKTAKPDPVREPARTQRKKRNPLRPRVAIAGCVCLLLAMWISGALRRKPALPPAQTLRLHATGGRFGVFGGQYAQQIYFVLPDHSLWRWGGPGPIGPRRPNPITTIEQVATTYDWSRIAVSYNHCIGLKTNGTLWRLPAGSELPPSLFSSDTNWVDAAITASGSYAVGLKQDGTLWEWGQRLPGVGRAVRPGGILTPTQVGTNDDWKAIAASFNSGLGIRRDGTLWGWGMLFNSGAFQGRPVNPTRAPEPVRICGETNWAGFVFSSSPLTRNTRGEVWELSFSPPSPNSPAGGIGQLLATNAGPGHFSVASTGERRVYEIRSDGTLWEKPSPLANVAGSEPVKWRRVGKRSDWKELHTAGPTAVGVTADGTIWIWGYDPTLSAPASFSAGLQVARARLAALFGGRSISFGPMTMPYFHKEPHAIMKMLPPE